MADRYGWGGGRRRRGRRSRRKGWFVSEEGANWGVAADAFDLDAPSASWNWRQALRTHTVKSQVIIHPPPDILAENHNKTNHRLITGLLKIIFLRMQLVCVSVKAVIVSIFCLLKVSPKQNQPHCATKAVHVCSLTSVCWCAFSCEDDATLWAVIQSRSARPGFVHVI